MKNVIVMGGSFNPPTIAHLKVMRTAVDALNAEVGYLAPVSHAYLKRKMVKAGCGHLCIPTAACRSFRAGKTDGFRKSKG